MMKKTFVLGSVIVLVIGFTLAAFSWGGNVHRFINSKTVYHLPGSMALFIQDSTFFAQHASDADNRKNSSDTSLYAESPRHFIDIDEYPDFHNLPHSLDTLIALYGWERVKRNGTNPWATKWYYDSLVVQLRRGDWGRATLTAADLGHYVGDSHQPLHATLNYDGQLTHNNGIHSRYESTMLSSQYYLSALYIIPDSVHYVGDRLGYFFDYLLHSNSLVDTIMRGDDSAKASSGWNGSGTPPPSYFVALWQRTRSVTLDQMQRGTEALANLWYSAWVDAGLIVTTGFRLPSATVPAEFSLAQNYPNPFNPATTISYTLPVGGTASLTVLSLEGKEVATLFEGNQSAGQHTVTFDASGLSSGVYFYRLQLGSFSQVRKLVLLK